MLFSLRLHESLLPLPAINIGWGWVFSFQKKCLGFQFSTERTGFLAEKSGACENLFSELTLRPGCPLSAIPANSFLISAMAFPGLRPWTIKLIDGSMLWYPEIHLGAGLGAVHDGVASVDGEGVSQLVQPGSLLLIPGKERSGITAKRGIKMYSKSLQGTLVP